MRLLIRHRLIIVHGSMGHHSPLVGLLFKHIRSFIWSWAIVRIQSRFAGLRPCSNVIALNTLWFVVTIVVVYEQIAGNGCGADSALDKVSVLLSWTTCAVDVLLSSSHSKQRASVIFVL